MEGTTLNAEIQACSLEWARETVPVETPTLIRNEEQMKNEV